ncbi:SDR family NAD(P)-dependent oxidoreductase [Streptomyces sp. NPDC002596]
MPRVLVTGAASGIGAGTAGLLARNGWEVVKADIAGGDDIVKLDVSDPESWIDVVRHAGPLDALVNCAGIRTRVGLLDLTLEIWEQTLRVNLSGCFLGIQTFARSLIDAKRQGAIVNVASVNAFHPIKGQPHYLASKAAVAMLTKGAALELAEHRIRVNAIAPGAIETPMLADRLAQPGQRDWLLGKIPWDRLGQPEDIAAGIAYLLSDAADYVTGVVLPIDGGQLLS